MDKNDFEKTFWYFYLELENEFLEIEKTIPVDSINSNTFSYKYMKLLESICAEMDVVFRRFFEHIGEEKSGINKYESYIEESNTDFKNAEITCFNTRHDNKKLYPFKNWSSDNPPKWWTINNKIKHHRDDISDNGLPWYKHANQENIINALAGLFQLNMYFYRRILKDEEIDDGFNVPLPLSKIFHLENWGEYYKYIIGSTSYFEIVGNVFQYMHENNLFLD